MDKKKVLILISVCLCVILFVVELLMIEMDTDGLYSISQVKKSFQEDIQKLKNGKYKNLTATDFEASIEEIKKICNLEILFSESYKNTTFLENYTSVLEDEESLEQLNTLELLYMQSKEQERLQENFQTMNQAIDKFFCEEVDKSYLSVEYYDEGDWIETEYSEFESLLEQGLTSEKNFLSMFGNDTSIGGYMIQIDNRLSGTWFSRGELGDIMPSLNECTERYPYLSGQRQGEDVVLHLLDGEIMLSEMEKKVKEYLSTDAFPFPGTDGISYEIGEARILENGAYDGICFLIRREYEGVPFEYGLFGTWYACDESEISYARSEVPDTIRAFEGMDGDVVEVHNINYMVSVGKALEILSDYFGDKNGVYEIRGVELVYKKSHILSEEGIKPRDFLEPKWKFIVCPSGSGTEIIYFVDIVTGEMG